MINEASFSRWSGRDLSTQQVEVLACRNCDGVAIGLPDEHSLYFDATDSQRTSFYGGARTIRCPMCDAIWYAGDGQAYRVRRVSPEEFGASAWAWLARPDA